MEVVAGHSIVNYHFSLQKLATRLAVTFLPCPLVASSHQIISPGFLLSVSTSISGLALEIINAYLHPRRLPQLGNALLTHLQTPHSGSHDLRIVGGDLTNLNLPNGYSSALDFFLIQSPDWVAQSWSPKFLTYWPSIQPSGHGIPEQSLGWDIKS